MRTFQAVVAATRSWGIGKGTALPCGGGRFESTGAPCSRPPSYFQAGNQLPWRLPGDMAYFKELTTRTHDPLKCNAVIMGRKTWESLPPRFRPLPGRLNVVLSRSGGMELPSLQGGQGLKLGSTLPVARVCGGLEAALHWLNEPETASFVEQVFVIGGGAVYEECLRSPQLQAVHLSRVSAAEEGDPDPECDVFMPSLPVAAPTLKLWSASGPIVENGLRCEFLCYLRENVVKPGEGEGKTASESSQAASESSQAASEAGCLTEHNGNVPEEDKGGKAPFAAAPFTAPAESFRTSAPFPASCLPAGFRGLHEEQQYLDLISEAISQGVPRGDRTGTGTLAVFGRTMRFNLRHSFPLLTTKRVFWRGVVEELLWFLAGSTDANRLKAKGVGIWDGNGSRAFLDSLGLQHREEGDLGPVYGFQWRHFGAAYADMHADYAGQGVDQVADLVHRIKTNPCDRRLLLCAWNPTAIPQMALPPCHVLAQFFVARGELSCSMYQRSADLGLGVPFNIASYALLTRMLAQVCGLRPGEFFHVLGDAHVYANHVEPLKEQLQNQPRCFP
ncbi:thymidylate synthase, partial [Helicosporidium sp. ATCC 50920]